jgi:hypothetical protein
VRLSGIQTPASSIKKSDPHDIAEILFKVALSTINLNPKPVRKSEDNLQTSSKEQNRHVASYNI